MNILNNTIVWIDMEMTGLDPVNDHILEIATIITDAQLNIVQEGQNIVIHQPEEYLQNLDPWVLKTHTHSGLLDEVRSSQTSLADAEKMTLALVEQYCGKRMGNLAGNSVWQDRAFMMTYMPTLVNYLHYRLIDVTSIKELVSRWYPNNAQVKFAKKDMHRALPDIHESIAELRHYRTYFFK